MVLSRLLFAPLVLCLAAPATAQGSGAAGILPGTHKEGLRPLTLSAGAPVSKAPCALRSGTCDEFGIVGDGSREPALTGPAIFRAIRIDRIVIQGHEIRPPGLEPVECDAAGEMKMGFVALTSGRYDLRIPVTTGETRRVDITIG